MNKAFNTEEEKNGGDRTAKPVDPVRNSGGVEHFVNVVDEHQGNSDDLDVEVGDTTTGSCIDKITP